MRITRTPIQSFSFFTQDNSNNNSPLANLHKKEVDNYIQSTENILSSNYKMSFKSLALTDNQKLRALVANTSKTEISSQSLTTSNIKAHIHQLKKEEEWKLTFRTQVAIDLDDEVDWDDVADQLKTITIKLAEGDMEKIEYLTEQFEKASQEFDKVLKFPAKMKNRTLKAKALKKIEEITHQDLMKDQNNSLSNDKITNKISSKNSTSKYRNTNFKELYTSFIAAPFEQMKPEMVFETSQTYQFAETEAEAYNSVEKTSTRLLDYFDKIIKTGQVSVQQVKAAFIHGFQSSTQDNNVYRLQEATYNRIIDVLDTWSEGSTDAKLQKK